MLKRRKRHAFQLHDERENVAAFVAPKAMPNLPFPRHVKRRGALRMKRADARKTPAPRGFQLNIAAHHVGHVQLFA